MYRPAGTPVISKIPGETSLARVTGTSSPLKDGCSRVGKREKTSLTRVSGTSSLSKDRSSRLGSCRSRCEAREPGDANLGLALDSNESRPRDGRRSESVSAQPRPARLRRCVGRVHECASDRFVRNAINNRALNALCLGIRRWSSLCERRRQHSPAE